MKFFFHKSGKFHGKKEEVADVLKAAELVGIPALVKVCTNYMQDEAYLNTDACTKFHREKVFKARELLIRQAHLAGRAYLHSTGI